MKNKWLVKIAAAASLVFATSASAAIVSYDLSGDGRNIGSPETFESDGLEMTARSQTERFGRWRSGGTLYQTSRGLGVYSGGFDSTQIDGRGRDEAILFSFDSAVELVGALFGSLNSNDDFNLAVYNNGWTTVRDDERSLGGTYVGTAFRFWADFFDDDFYVKGLSFDDSPKAVPEPAALVLMGLGLVAVGISRRQTKS